jgi:hypothetical protein
MLQSGVLALNWDIYARYQAVLTKMGRHVLFIVIRLNGLVTWTHYLLAFLFIVLFFQFLYGRLPRD